MEDATHVRAMTLERLRRQRDEIIRAAAARGAANVRVFGSVARGEAGASSDVDLLVDVTADVDGFAYFGLLEDLEADLRALLGCEVDVVELQGPYSPEGQQMADRIQRDTIPL